MLIASKFHDYYDSITAYGIDKTVVYQRQEKSIKLKRNLDWRKQDMELTHNETHIVVQKGKRFRIEVSKFVVGFCGHLYPGIRVSVRHVDTHTAINYHFYSAAKAWKFLMQIGVKEDKYEYGIWRLNRYRTDNKKQLENFFELNHWKDSLVIFQAHNVPTFVFRRNAEDRGQEIVCNPRLADYNFEKVKSPPTAFQEIYMYISGVLGMPARPMVEVSDKTKAAKKGHDGRYSFRTPPKSKKRK